MTPITKEKTDLEVGNLLLLGRESSGELGILLRGVWVFGPPLALLLRGFCVLGIEPPGADGQKLCTWAIDDSSSSQVFNGQRTGARTNQVPCCVHDRGSTARQRFRGNERKDAGGKCKRGAVARDVVGRRETDPNRRDVSPPFPCVLLSELPGKHDPVFTMNFSPAIDDDDIRDLAGSLTSFFRRPHPYPSPIR